jgi:hypothetical protein
VATLLRAEGSWETKRKTNRRFAWVLAISIGGFVSDRPAWCLQDWAEVLLARKLLRWNQKWRHREVESDAVATPIIKGTLVIDSEETA